MRYSLFIRSTFFGVLAVIAGTATVNAQEEARSFDISSLVDVDGLSVNELAIEALDEAAVQLVFDASLERYLARQSPGLAGSNISLRVSGKGNYASDESVSQDSILGELALVGHVFHSSDREAKKWAGNAAAHELSRPAARLARVTELQNLMASLEMPRGEVDPFQQSTKTPEYIELERELKQITGSDDNIIYISLDGHARYESSQDFDDSNVAVGAGVAFDLGLLGIGDFVSNITIANILDVPFSLFRSKKASSFRPELPRFYFGYDHVADSDVASLGDAGQTDDFDRLMFEAAWKTLILDQLVLRAKWIGFQQLDAPESIDRADKDRTSFIEVTAAVPVRDNLELFVRYADGELPPTQQSDSTIGLGFNLSFRPL